jgi:hypothetical protein
MLFNLLIEGCAKILSSGDSHHGGMGGIAQGKAQSLGSELVPA